MVEIPEDLSDFAFEVEHRDPNEESLKFYEQGEEDMCAGLVLDGLLNFYLAKDYLDGFSAPHNIRQKYPLKKTLPYLELRIEKARAELREYGPVRPDVPETSSEPDVSGQN